MTASFFFPSQRINRIRDKVVFTHDKKDGGLATKEICEKSKKFNPENFHIENYKQKRVFKLFQSALYNFSNSKVTKAKKVSGDGIPADYCPEKAEDIFQSYVSVKDLKIAKKNGKKIESDISDSKTDKKTIERRPGSSIRKAFGVLIKSMGIIPEIEDSTSYDSEKDVEKNVTSLSEITPRDGKIVTEKNRQKDESYDISDTPSKQSKESVVLVDIKENHFNFKLNENSIIHTNHESSNSKSNQSDLYYSSVA